MTFSTTGPVRNWYAAAFRYLGGKPESYLCVDTETQGVNPNSDSVFVTQFGYVLVEGGQVVAMESSLLNWAHPDSGVDANWFRASLEETAAAMAAKGKPYQTSWARVQREGKDPYEVLEEARALIAEAMAQDYALVAHNGFAFDMPLLERHFRLLDRPLALPPERLVDTGLLEKARLMGWTPPHPGEHPRADWYDQIKRAYAKGVRWSLDSACAAEYGLLDQEIDHTMAHDAAVDCLLTHRLLEKMGERAGVAALV